ncbi:MAG: type II toxin-antitoxin system RelB/DinJ family antitoxin [Deltaproteobacteria bacterium]|jgi:DNA-damage-inducible protein J|nr:type II toxin-antitoxin system RelB/DinJ family antitoxin [Deltaproteobacteria bacterium]
MPANDYVRARIDPAIKNEAACVLSTLGLTVSDACRMMLTKIAREKRLPFGTEEPNEESLAAIREIEEGKGVRFHSAEALFEDLGI